MAKVETVLELVTRVKSELAKNAPYRPSGGGSGWTRPDKQILLDLEELVEIADNTLPKAMENRA